MKKQLILVVALVSAMLFAPTSMIFFFGMMPTIACNVIDRTRQKSRTISVGVMNFAGVMPFLLELWLSPAPNSIDHAISIMMEPKTIIIMYCIAATGYAIEAAITGMVATMMQQRATARLKQIDQMLAELQDRWNYYVDGSVTLDDFGFPVEEDDD
ncbi:MAG: hypothetical protein KGQ41_07040 [Alphaproteobacteria bacterium]|nr:hypothetical protein [Alphaproteobacteria bacterium]